jgi:hypothetical protein
MKIDPLSTALKEIAETRALLESLLISSEQFDYPKAKLAIGQLRKKLQNLAKTQARFEELLREREPEIRVLNFRQAAPPSAQNR